MSDEIKVGRLARDFSAVDVTFTRKAGEPVRMTFPASSEAPVDRWFGTEVLSHDAKAVRMDRLAAGAAPLLFNHDWSDPVGMVDAARLRDGRLYVDAHLFDTARAQEVAAMVEGGLRNISIGYEIEEMAEDAKRQVFTATRWLPLEVSIVTVPADHTVGIGRAADDQAKPVRVVRAATDPTPDPIPAAAAASPKESHVDQTTPNAAAGANAETQQRALPAQPAQGPSAMDLERARTRGIENLCKALGVDDNLKQHFIGSGLGIDKVSEDLLAIQVERSKSAKPVTAIGMSEKDVKSFSLTRAIRAAAENNWTNAGHELEASRSVAQRLNKVPEHNRFYVPFEVLERSVERPLGRSFMTAGSQRQFGDIQRRDLTVASGSGGGFLVSTENQSFIEMLRNRAVAYRMGARRLGGLQGSVTVPRQTGAATAYWLSSESTQITESDQVFGQMALSPKTVGAYTEISRQLLLQSSPDAEGIVTSDLATVTSLAYDVGVLRGSGASGQPTGIVNTAGIGSVSGTGFIAAAFARILEFQTDVATANVYPAMGGYVTTPSVAASLIQAVKYASTASPVWEGNVWDGAVQGFPAMGTNQMTAASMLFGDWSQVVVGEWGVLEVEVNPYANFQAGIIGVRAMVSMDCGLRYPAAFSLATSIA